MNDKEQMKKLSALVESKLTKVKESDEGKVVDIAFLLVEFEKCLPRLHDKVSGVLHKEKQAIVKIAKKEGLSFPDIAKLDYKMNKSLKVMLTALVKDLLSE